MEKKQFVSQPDAEGSGLAPLTANVGASQATPTLKEAFAGRAQMLPREKIAALGAAALSDAELLALLLRTGRKGRNVLAVAEDLLHEHGDNLGQLSSATWIELSRSAGIGPARASELSAVFEIARRILSSSIDSMPKFDSPETVARYLRPWTIGESVERFFVLPLDKKLRLCGTVQRTTAVSSGTADSTFAHPRDIFRVAVRADACYVTVAHNHPSGDPKPSASDIKLTRDLVEAGHVLRIPVLDHVVIGDIPAGASDAVAAVPRFVSMRASGLVDFD